jgi:hypothetical protein
MSGENLNESAVNYQGSTTAAVSGDEGAALIKYTVIGSVATVLLAIGLTIAVNIIS